jgi:hypothetical protein
VTDEQQPAQDQVPEAPSPPQRRPSPAVVERHGDWQRVTYGVWQVSVGPDGLIMLPRHLHPQEWQDFAGCMNVAVDVAGQVVAANKKRGENDKVVLPPRKAVVTQGPPPPGTARMHQTSAQHRAAAIGRPKRPAQRRAAQAAQDEPAPRVAGRNTRRRTAT